MIPFRNFLAAFLLVSLASTADAADLPRKSTVRGAKSKKTAPVKTGSESQDSAGRFMKDIQLYKKPDWRSTRLGIGLDIGSNAMFGNALTLHYDLLPFVELRGGLGYNMSGGKAGFAAGGRIPFGIFGVTAGSGFVRSSANSDKVRVPARFTPDGSSTVEEVTAIRNYRISPSTYSTTYVGGYIDLDPQIRFSLDINWNKVTAGNEVELSGETEFDQPIEVTNEDEMLPDFNTAARKKLDINGPGIAIGVQYRM